MIRLPVTLNPFTQAKTSLQIPAGVKWAMIEQLAMTDIPDIALVPVRDPLSTVWLRPGTPVDISHLAEDHCDIGSIEPVGTAGDLDSLSMHNPAIAARPYAHAVVGWPGSGVDNRSSNLTANVVFGTGCAPYPMARERKPWTFAVKGHYVSSAARRLMAQLPAKHATGLLITMPPDVSAASVAVAALAVEEIYPMGASALAGLAMTVDTDANSNVMASQLGYGTFIPLSGNQHAVNLASLYAGYTLFHDVYVTVLYGSNAEDIVQAGVGTHFDASTPGSGYSYSHGLNARRTTVARYRGSVTAGTGASNLYIQRVSALADQVYVKTALFAVLAVGTPSEGSVPIFEGELVRAYVLVLNSGVGHVKVQLSRE